MTPEQLKNLLPFEQVGEHKNILKAPGLGLPSAKALCK